MSASVPPAGEARRDEVLRRLRRVIDPEIGLDIVTLGLVYDLAVSGDAVTVTMTLTTQGCPLGDAIGEGVRAAVAELPWVGDVVVNLVWEPAWSPAMIREDKERSR